MLITQIVFTKHYVQTLYKKKVQISSWVAQHIEYPFHGGSLKLRVRVRRPAWQRVISASGAPRDNNRTWEPISITTRKENGPVSARLPDGSDGARPASRSRALALSLPLPLTVLRATWTIAQSRAKHRPANIAI